MCKVSRVKCVQTGQKETKEVCMPFLKRSINNPLPGTTHRDFKRATVEIKTHLLFNRYRCPFFLFHFKLKIRGHPTESPWQSDNAQALTL